MMGDEAQRNRIDAIQNMAGKPAMQAIVRCQEMIHKGSSKQAMARYQEIMQEHPGMQAIARAQEQWRGAPLKHAIARYQEIMQESSVKQVAARIQEKIENYEVTQWKHEFGFVPYWVEKRKPNDIQQINRREISSIGEPPKSTIVLIRADDSDAVKSARARINAGKAKEKADAKREKLIDDYLSSGLSKNQFAKKHHKKYYVTEKYLRKKLQGIENKINIITNDEFIPMDKT